MAWKTTEIPLSLYTWCSFPGGPDVQKTVAIPTGAVLGHGVHARSWCVWCRLPDSADNCGGPAVAVLRKSSVAVCCLVVDALVVHVVLDMPVVVQRQAGYGPDSAENCLEVPQVQYLRCCGRRCDLAATVPALLGGASDSFIDGMFKC